MCRFVFRMASLSLSVARMPCLQRAAGHIVSPPHGQHVGPATAPAPATAARVGTHSQIQFGADSENTLFALFWLNNPSNRGETFSNAIFLSTNLSIFANIKVLMSKVKRIR